MSLPQRRLPPGFVPGLGAYILWGLVPVYFHALGHVSPWVVLAHRILWSSLFLGAVIHWRGEWAAVRALCTQRRSLAYLSIGAVLIATNWLIFIYAVASHQLLQASLGYFINPLVSIALGLIFLKERLRAWQWLALGIACLGVLNQALRGAALPWIALSLAFSFGLYGLVRKKVDANSLHGLFIETSFLLPAAIVLALWPAGQHYSSWTWTLLSLAGLITAVPLLMFGAAVRRLRLSTMGFLQYVGPTMQFGLAVLAFGEQLDWVRLASFGLCWIAIGIYVIDSVVNRRTMPVDDRPE